MPVFRKNNHHFGPRETAHYWGTWPADVGQSANVDWPLGDGPRVFGYLKPFKALEALLDRLSTLWLPTLIVGDGIEAAQERFASETLRFVRYPIEAATAGQWCEIAILNATHGMLAAMLLAGKPTLNIPLHLEQRLAAMKVVQWRAGVAASGQEPEGALRAFDFVLANRDRLAARAQRFAERYRDFDAGQQVERLLGRLEKLL